MPNLTTEQAALAADLRKAERARAKARRIAAQVAALYLDGDKRPDGQPRFTRDDVATATLAAVKAERAVSAARAAFLATIKA